MSIRSTRAGLAKLLAVILALTLFAAACGDDGDDGAESTDGTEAPDGDGDGDGEGTGSELAPTDTVSTVPGAEELEPQEGGTLRVAVEAEADSLNPASGRFANAAYTILGPVMDNLVYFDTEGNWFPYLAESFSPSDDLLSWQMTVRGGVVFHDGTTLDADDVIASFQAQFDDPVVSLALRYRFDNENPIERVDDLTVQYNLSRPEAAFPNSLGSQLGMVIPSEYAAAALENPELNQEPPGTGPFMISSRTQDEVTILTRFDDYWGADLQDVYLDEIQLFPITDPVIAAERLNSNDLDLVVTSNIDAILTMREGPGTTIENLRSGEDFAMVNTERAPFDDLRARQALTHATPREAILRLIRQDVTPVANTMFHPDLFWHNPDIEQLSDQPDLAAPLVVEYCADFPENCADGRINIELQYSGPSVTASRTAEVLIDGWEDYFNVTEEELLQDAHINDVVFGEYNVVTWRQFGEPAPANDTLWINCESIGPISLNFPRYCDEDRQALINELVATDDIDRQKELWFEIQQNIADSYTYTFFNHANWAIGAGENVQAVCGQTAPDGTEIFCNNQGRVRLRSVWLS